MQGQIEADTAGGTGGRPVLKVGVVGGGRECLDLVRLFQARGPERLGAKIAGLAEPDPEAAGRRFAAEQGIPVFRSVEALMEMPGLDLVVNLSPDPSAAERVRRMKPEHVALIDRPAGGLLEGLVEDALSLMGRLGAQADELSRVNSFVGAMAELTEIGVMILDDDYRVAWINRSALNRARLTREEALGRYCFQISHNARTPCDSLETPCPMKETLRTGQLAHAIHEHMDQGQASYCDVSTFPLFNRKGEAVQVLEVIRDITSDLNAKLERRTRAIKDDLARLVQEDKMISLGKLVASVAHEINNPIASILTFNKLMLKTIREGTPPPEELAAFERYLDLSVLEAQRCGRIVGNLLSFARRQPIEPKRIDLAEILDRIVTLIRHQMDLANVSLEVSLDKTPLEIWGDYTQIQQCLTNFIFNALEAMPDGGRLAIRGGPDAAGRLVRIEIEDTGSGIAPEHLDRIFEPFFSTKAEGHGVGLGLAMVYGIIRDHRGRIEVESEPGRGTTFRVLLPPGPAGGDGLMEAGS
ncbi:MAG: PAS domain-containing protein [Proteobacteria bacterium]|nr:PAS domain-containing protein [Pseudomonadota bacterium]